MDKFEIIKKIQNEYLDFIYIDANHKYEKVLEDLNAWFSKIKENGIICGDDYLGPYGVTQAVQKFAYDKKMLVHISTNGKQFLMQKKTKY